MKTIIVDIDGCIIEQNGGMSGQLANYNILPGVVEKFDQWSKSGYKIIIITARKESCRAVTEKVLNYFGLFWDELIMGMSGVRVLINDLKPGSDNPTAVAINLPRNSGLSSVEV